MKKRFAVLFFAALVWLTSCVSDNSSEISSTTLEYTKLDMDALTRLNGGKLPDISYNDDNIIEYIDGVVAGFPVYSAEDAYRAIYGTAELLGITDVNAEIKLDRVSDNSVDNIFSFSQFYNDIRVIGVSVTLIADKETGTADYLYSTYRRNITIDTVPTLSSNDAVNTVKTAYGVNVSGSPELVIYSVDIKSNETVLVWEIKTDNQTPSVVYVDAHTGQVVYAQLPWDDN